MLIQSFNKVIVLFIIRTLLVTKKASFKLYTFLQKQSVIVRKHIKINFNTL